MLNAYKQTVFAVNIFMILLFHWMERYGQGFVNMPSHSKAYITRDVAATAFEKFR